jgi:hypothetical protein
MQLQPAKPKPYGNNLSIVITSQFYLVLLHSQIERIRGIRSLEAKNVFQDFCGFQKLLAYLCTPFKKTVHRNRRGEGRKAKIFLHKVWKFQKNHYLCTPKQNKGIKKFDTTSCSSASCLLKSNSSGVDKVGKTE